MKVQWLYVTVGVKLASTWNHANNAGNGKVELGTDVGFAIRQRLRPSCHSGGGGWGAVRSFRVSGTSIWISPPITCCVPLGQFHLSPDLGGCWEDEVRCCMSGS